MMADPLPASEVVHSKEESSGVVRRDPFPSHLYVGRVALVTGGTGFLGAAIAHLLVERGMTVRALARGHTRDTMPHGVVPISGDIRDESAVDVAVADCDVVFHTAAKAGVWGARSEFESINIGGSAKILRACQKHGVKGLIHTSSPSVAHAGGDIEGANEVALGYPEHFSAHYPRTKSLAERMMLAADGIGGVRTVALRPHLIWGPGDHHLVPRLLARAAAGRLALVGDGTKRVDSTYIDNAAEAHLNAYEALMAPGATCGGRAYFISNGEPWSMVDLVNGIVGAGGYPPVRRFVPYPVAWALGAMLEGAYGLFGVASEPPMTRFVAEQLATAHWFDIGAARRDLGYAPRVSIADGLTRLAAHLKASPQA